MKIWTSQVDVFCIAAGLIGTIVCEASAQDSWIEVGPALRSGMQFKVSGSSYVQILGLHAASAPLSEPPSIGAPAAYSDRTYADGYVKLDSGTLNPDAVGGMGNTWNWAYNHPGQFDSAANTLSFHQSSAVGYTTLRDDPVAAEANATGAGLQVQAGWNVVKNEKWRVDVGVGFQGIWGACSRISLSSYLERTSQLNVTDTYNVAGTVDPTTGFPGPQTAPGGYAGQYNVPGPTITNIPASRASQRTDLSMAQNQMDFRFETDIYEVTFNPRFSYTATPRLSLNCTPKLGVSYLEVTADRTETFAETATGGGTTTLGSWHDRRTEGAWRFATGLAAGVDLDLGHGYYAGINGGYEWTVNEVRITIGPNSVALNGSGWVAGLVVGRRF